MSNYIYYYDWTVEMPEFVRGKGVYLYDKNGKEYLDGASGSISNSLAHGRKDMVRVIEKQAEELAFTSRMMCKTKPLLSAVEKMHEVTGMDRFFLVSGGTESTEIAVKMARAYWVHKGRPEKYKILSRWQSYHGFSMGALAWGGLAARRREYVPYLREDGHVAPPYCYRCWFGKECGKCNFECANALETEILCQGADNVAAFLCETIIGNALAAAVPPDGYYQRIRQICDQYDILYIADEVMCGIGRTGKMNAFDHYPGAKPDIAAYAKALGGGYFPIGCAACTEAVAGPVKEYGHFLPGYTWAGNPVAAAVVTRTLEIIEEENLLDNVKERGEQLKRGLRELQKKHPSVGDVRGLGLMLGVEFVKNPLTKEPFRADEGFGRTFVKRCKERGLILNYCGGFDKGVQGEGVIFGPNFEVRHEDINRFLDLFEQGLADTERSFF